MRHVSVMALDIHRFPQVDGLSTGTGKGEERGGRDGLGLVGLQIFLNLAR